MTYFFAALLRTLVWGLLLSLILWLARKYLPPRVVRILFKKLF